MREHQIVITLKPDQFLEVQRLARAANAKSMGVFVRQKLLAALGIEGTLEGEASANGTAQIDLDAVLSDLKRVHGELKSFVAESLSPYSPEAFGQTEFVEPEPQPMHVFEQSEDSIAGLPDDDDFDYDDLDDEETPSPAVAELEPVHNDEMEKVADRTFAISPRLGPIGDPAPQQQTTASDPGNSKDLLFRHELHYRRDVHRYHHPHSSSEMDVPFNHGHAVEKDQPAPSVVPSTAGGPAADTLSMLLSSDDVAPRQKPTVQPLDADDDTFDVPLSIAERRRLMAEEPDEQAYVEHHPALSPTLPHELGSSDPSSYSGTSATEEQQRAPQPQPEPENSVEPETAGEQSSDNGSASASPPDPPAPNELGRPLGYPPLSGSPPPKRRQV